MKKVSKKKEGWIGYDLKKNFIKLRVCEFEPTFFNKNVL
jgi:hypothetical protein